MTRYSLLHQGGVEEDLVLLLEFFELVEEHVLHLLHLRGKLLLHVLDLGEFLLLAWLLGCLLFLTLFLEVTLHPLNQMRLVRSVRCALLFGRGACGGARRAALQQ